MLEIIEDSRKYRLRGHRSEIKYLLNLPLLKVIIRLVRA